jgi:predicted metalloprotease with PDZ domain
VGKLARTLGRPTLIRYRIRLADLAKHHFEVTCEIPAPADVQRITLPSWLPGSYLLREFARHVVALEATSGGRKVEVEKVDKGTWACAGAHGELTIRATIYALDQSVRGAFLDRRRGYFNGACLFLFAEGRETEAVEAEIVAPDDPVAEEWRVATALTAVAVDARGFGKFRAADYAELIDHPVEVSDFAHAAFTAGGVPHELVVAGKIDSDLERVASDLRQICEAQIEFFGRPPPFMRYVFLGLAVGDGYGGLEHRASSSLIFGRDDLPKPGEPSVPRAYQRFLALASHEYFHTWHVKRTKPAVFMPYRLDRRNHTRSLWVFEGITSYYQDLFLLRSGLIGAQAYLQRLGEQLTRVYRTPGRFRQSLAASSFDAWDSLYKPEPNSPNTGVSYYTKGALVALALDLTLRTAAEPHSLDEVMRALWQRYGAVDIGVPEDGFERLALEIGGPALATFFATAVHGTEDLPLGDLLGACGIKLNLRPASGSADPGGTPAAKDDAPFGLGAVYRSRDGGLELAVVFDDGPAQTAGLCPGDLVVAIGGLRVGERNLASRLAREESGATVRVTAFRGDELIEVDLVLAPPALDTCYLEPDSRGSSEALARRRAWLGE